MFSKSAVRQGPLLGLLLFLTFPFLTLGNSTLMVIGENQIAGSVQSALNDKTVLSVSDQVVVSFVQPVSIRKGESVGILGRHGGYYYLNGESKVVQILSPQKVVCIINKINREIAVGDKVIYPVPYIP